MSLIMLLLSFRAKIQELFVDLFGAIHMPKSIYSDVTIIKYDKNKIKLNVQYSYYTGRDGHECLMIVEK